MIKIGNTYILHDGEEMHKTMKMHEINKATNIISIKTDSEGREFVVLNKLKYRQIGVPMRDHLSIQNVISKST